ncbi:TQO small subunit DoxA domain-containing protein [Vulcanisaeta thermophila]|uniref:TQO small subunit DoxA domain-containing protein n=1 Tax=Vulcanisaeta thermophila TaxID=867917 RepID=UPI0008538BF4|nr:TQO small subunit DoxA domain-containing protein [Vulcanisaeta thermophila]
MDRATVIAILGFIIATGITFGLYQINFQGFTHLTNYSKTPAYSLSGTELFSNGTLLLHITRVAGPDTYGGFIVLVQVLYPNGTIAYEWNSTYLGHIPQDDIINKYNLPGHLVHSDGFALVVPLGQSAVVRLYAPIHFSPGTYIVRVYDVDGEYEAYGIKFQITVTVTQ